MEKIKVELEDKSYNIIVGEKLEEINEYIGKYSKILILTNNTVGKLYGEKLREALKERSIYYYELKDGEEYKNLESAKEVYDVLIDNEFTRDSLIISLGGGVICDLTGYIASTYMRGIDFVQIPTSLLAQVDASVGGKVAINYRGKNLIGSFYQPKLVFMDTSLLKTLDEREIKTGIAETLKIALCFDKDFYEFLYENSEGLLNLDLEIVNKVVKRACELKAYVVSQDEKEQGLRAILNYGHSFGHVIERLTNYKAYRHGEAVIIGMEFALKLAVYLSLADKEYLELQEKLFEKYNLKYSIPKYEYKRMLEVLKRDKKNKNGKIKFIFSTELGKAVNVAVDENDLEKFYKDLDGNKVRSVIDLGTNTCRLFIAEVNNNEIIHKYIKMVEIIKLGEGVDKNKFLLESAINRAIETFKKYSDISKSYASTEIIARATSATRDASNRDEFIKNIKEETGIDLLCISGNEEGELTFKGASTVVEGDILLVDIGGGSTELVYGNQNQGITYLKSFDIGAVRLTEKFYLDENANENFEINKDKALEWKNSIFDEIDRFKDREFTLIGVAGTATTQVTVKEEMEVYNSEIVHKYLLKKEDLIENINKFKKFKVEERKQIKGLEEKRADVIVAGSEILLFLMNKLDKNEIIISENDILDGIMLD